MPNNPSLYKGGSGKNLRKVCRKFVSGIFWYPPANFFQNRRFFHQFFWDPPNFFRKCKFFPLKIWDPPIFFQKWKIFPTENLGPTHIPTTKNRSTVHAFFIIKWFIRKLHQTGLKKYENKEEIKNVTSTRLQKLRKLSRIFFKKVELKFARKNKKF